MFKKITGKFTIILITLMVIAITAYFSITNEKLKDTIITLISLSAAVAVFVQIKQGTDIAKADFVMGLQETFSNSKGFSKLFITCWNEYADSGFAYGNVSNNQYDTNSNSVKTFLDNDDGKEVLINYLTFFESIYLMKEMGNLDFKILDELFGRRFFIVITNKTVQEEELCTNILYHDNVKKLYEDWVNYREKLITQNKAVNDCKDTDIIRKTKFLAFHKHSSNQTLADYNYQKNKFS